MVWSVCTVRNKNVYYYITAPERKLHMPAMPAGAEEGIRKGIYKLRNLTRR